MYKFPKEKIEIYRNTFLDEGYDFITVDLEKYSFNYFVVPQNKNLQLPDFALRVTGDPADGYVLGVSDSIREEFRPYVALHEYLEFMEIGIDTNDRCVKALDIELDVMRKNFEDYLQGEYIGMRKSFFGNLIKYAIEVGMPQEDIKEFNKSYEKLENLIKL